MKKYFTLIILLFISINSSLFSQITPYLVSEQLETARSEATKVISNPVFRGAATFNGVIPGVNLGGSPVESIFYDTEDANKGKATGWVYVFSSEDNPTAVASIFVVNLPFGTQAINLNDLGIPLDFLAEFAYSKSLDAFQWINSDVMVDKLKAAPEYLSFAGNNPNPIPRQIFLGFSVGLPQLNPDNPYWFIKVHNQDDTDSTIVIIDAVTGETTDVFDEQSLINVVVKPNPSQDFINLDLDNFDLNYLESIDIYNLNGIRVLTTKNVKNIDMRNLNNGSYYLLVNYKNAKYMKKIIVNK